MTYTHGLCKIPEYLVWTGMKRRCRDSRAKGYSRYGARGIAVCPRWLDSFAAFYADMGPRPTPNHHIDRIDNDGPYSPENCRWATAREQARNRRDNTLITFDGTTLCLQAWAERVGISAGVLCDRLQRGWPLERALKTDVTRGHLITFDGKTMSIRAWALRLGMKPVTLQKRFRDGWSVQDALSTGSARTG